MGILVKEAQKEFASTPGAFIAFSMDKITYREFIETELDRITKLLKAQLEEAEIEGFLTTLIRFAAYATLIRTLHDGKEVTEDSLMNFVTSSMEEGHRALELVEQTRFTIRKF